MKPLAADFNRGVGAGTAFERHAVNLSLIVNGDKLTSRGTVTPNFQRFRGNGFQRVVELGDLSERLIDLLGRHFGFDPGQFQRS